MSPNPNAGEGGAYSYDPNTDQWTQTEAPTAPPTITPNEPPVLKTTSGNLRIVTNEF